MSDKPTKPTPDPNRPTTSRRKHRKRSSVVEGGEKAVADDDRRTRKKHQKSSIEQKSPPTLMPLKIKLKLNNCFSSITTGLQVYIMECDLTEVRVSALVCPSNDMLVHDHGIGQAIATIAGPKLQEHCDKYINQHGKLPMSGTAVCRGYTSFANYIICALGPRWSDYHDKIECADDLKNTILNCLQDADTLSCSSIAIPAISSGTSLTVNSCKF